MRRCVIILGLTLLATPASASPLTVQAVRTDSGTIRVGYGDALGPLLEVLYDPSGLGGSPCPGGGITLGCDAIQFGGAGRFTFVLPLAAAIQAVSYAVTGTYDLDGQVFTTPQTFSFTFLTPTTGLPLPTYALVPPDVPSGWPVPGPWRPVASVFTVSQVEVTRARVPEAGTLGTLGLLGVGLVGLWRRR